MPALPYLAPLPASSQRKNAIELVAAAARNNRQAGSSKNKRTIIIILFHGVSYLLPSPSFLQTGKRGDWSTGITSQPFPR